MAMPRFQQCVNPVETPFPVVQGAYILCCAALTGKAEEKTPGCREYRCTADSPHITSRERTNIVLASAPKPGFIVDSSAEDWLKFQKLVGQWRHERGARSSITETVMMPAYQEIIGMGQTAFPLILAQLRSEGDEPDQWFWALRAITGVNPVKPEDQGNFQKMAQTWLQWAGHEFYAL